MKRMASMQTDQRLQRLVLQSAIAQKRSHRWIFTSNQRICTTTTRRSWRFFLIKANQDKVMESHQPRHQYHLKRWEGIKWITATGPFIMFKINTIILIWTTHQWSVAASHWGPNVSTVRHIITGQSTQPLWSFLPQWVSPGRHFATMKRSVASVNRLQMVICLYCMWSKKDSPYLWYVMCGRAYEMK